MFYINNMSKKKTTKEFITDAIKVHGNLYDYSLVNYINNKTKNKIICQNHGVFEQTPKNHLKNQGCPKCGGRTKLTNEDFITKANIIHNNKYDYSLADYINYLTKINILCPTHGNFIQTPNNHLSGKGCIKCYKNNNITLIRIKYTKFNDIETIITNQIFNI